ncbi:MAG: phosphate ABC transporter ATP-binding protein [Spirochaetia bacterium]
MVMPGPVPRTAAPRGTGSMAPVAETPKVRIQGLSYWYDGRQSLNGVTLDVPDRAITVLFGPAGGGKTTLMRVVNRLNDMVDGTKMTGRVLLDGEDIYAPDVDVIRLRRRVGMVFALPLPLPGSVRDNVIYGPRLAGVRGRARLSEVMERSLTQAALWAEVKDRLDQPALSLSGGQQQRLCIARSLSLEPEVLLLDEPTSGLDPISTAKVEESLFQLKLHYAVLIVPHSVQQAARVADIAAFFLGGDLVECGDGPQVFTAPRRKETEDYVTGRFG